MENKTLESRFHDSFERLNIPRVCMDYIVEEIESLKSHHIESYKHTLRVIELVGRVTEYVELDKKLSLYAAALHDASKSEIDTVILNKQGKYDKHDWKIIKEHPVRAYERHKDKFPFTSSTILRVHRYQKNMYPAKLPVNEPASVKKSLPIIDCHARHIANADFLDSIFTRNQKLSLKEKENVCLNLNYLERGLAEFIFHDIFLKAPLYE